MIQNIKKKKIKKNTTCSNNITQNIQANIYYLHFNKNFITLDLKMKTFEAERISKGRMFHLSTIL